MIWQTARHSLDLSTKGAIMGILNVTPDSFSDGGRFMPVRRAVDHALDMLAGGAAIIDIGGESTRPGALPISAEDELSRVLPVLEELLKSAPDCTVSIDTSKASVAAAALERGAAIVNDITALRGDPQMAKLVAHHGAGLVLMHMQGTPRTMQQNPEYKDVAAEVTAFFHEQLAAARAAGIDLGRIVFDPGIGFGKTVDHNLTLLRHAANLGIEGRPLMMGVSRKSFLSKVAGDSAERLWPTVALTALLREKGVRVLRVHDVRPNLAALKMAEALL